MKQTGFFAFFLLVFTLTAFSQGTPTEVLQRARQKCLEIQNGRYTLVRKFKFFSGTDTSTRSGLVIFEKNPADSVFGLTVWVESLTDSFAKYYDGRWVYTIDHRKKAVTIDSSQNRLYSAIHGNTIGSFINFSFSAEKPMSMLDDSTLTPVFEENYRNNNDTQAIAYHYLIDGDSSKGVWARWFFDSKTGYPVAKEVKIEDDSEIQYEHFKVTSFAFNNPQYTQWLAGPKWPAAYDTFFSQPYVSPKPLPNDTIAPGWEAVTLQGDSISFAQLSSKLYLVDFWYRSCHPCVQAMPFLQTMQDKYADSGLLVIGLNPFDYKDKDTQPFKSFMERRNVSYTIAFIDRKVTQSYRVNAFPTLYLIDSSGKIVHCQIGYGETTDAKIDKIINDYLTTH